MPGHDKLFDTIGDVFGEVEDFVRPVTDPIRRFTAKAIPKELKPFVAPVATAFVPFGDAGSLASLLGGTAYDAFFQKAMTDPDDEDTDIDYLSALMTGIGKSVAATDIPKERFADPASKNVVATATPQVSDLPFSPAPSAGDLSFSAAPDIITYAPAEGLSTAKTFAGGASEYDKALDAATKFNTRQLIPGTGDAGALTAGNIGSNISRATESGIKTLFDPSTAFEDGNILGLSKLATGASLTRTPSVIKAAKQAEEDYENYLRQQREAGEADAAEFEAERKRRYLSSFANMGIDIDRTLEVMQANGIDVTREEIEATRTDEITGTNFPTNPNAPTTNFNKGGRVGFDNGGAPDIVNPLTGLPFSSTNAGPPDIISPLIFTPQFSNIMEGGLAGLGNALQNNPGMSISEIIQANIANQVAEQYSPPTPTPTPTSTPTPQVMPTPQAEEGIKKFKSSFKNMGLSKNQFIDALLKAGYATRAGARNISFEKGGRVGFAEGTQTDNMTIGDFVKAEEARTKFLDQIERKMKAQEFNMRQNQPSGIGKMMNMMNPFDQDPMREQPIMDMKTRYMDMMFDMKKKSMEDATKLREEMLREEMRKKNRKDDFNNIVDMLDDRFSENRQQRKMANKGGSMTPEGDPISPDVPKGMQMDLRGGGFIPLGTKPRADDVPAMVGKNEFVLNDRAVSGIGKMLTGNPDPRAGARALYDLQNKMEAIV